MNLIAYAADGLHDWTSTQRISLKTSALDDHHIYPRAYIASRPELDIDNDEAEQLVDCVANRTLIPKNLNLRIGHRAPVDYLSELQRTKNPQLATCLGSHLIPTDLLTDPIWNGFFSSFLEERAHRIFNLIKHEQPQTISFLLSYLDSAKSAEVFTLLSPDLREEVVERLGEKYQVEQLAAKYDFTGRTPMDVPKALEVKEELETIDKLLKQIEEAKENLSLIHI